jgi:hypothetical protein
MYFSDYDSEQHVLVCRLAGVDIPQSDYDQCCSDTRALIEKARECRQKPLAVIAIGKECSSPNALQRRQIAELAVAATGLDYLVLMVTPSGFVRGVVTALRWIRPQPAGTDVAMVADNQAAVRWLKNNRPTQAESAEALLKRVEYQLRRSRGATAGGT